MQTLINLINAHLKDKNLNNDYKELLSDLNTFIQHKKCNCECNCKFISNNNTVTITKSCSYHSQKLYCDHNNEHFVPILYNFDSSNLNKFEELINFNEFKLNILDKNYLKLKLDMMYKKYYDSFFNELNNQLNNYLIPESNTENIEDLSFNSIKNNISNTNFDVSNKIKQIKENIINLSKMEDCLFYTLDEKVIRLALIDELLMLGYKIALFNNKIIILLKEFSVSNFNEKSLISFILDNQSNIKSSSISVDIINNIHDLMSKQNLEFILI